MNLRHAAALALVGWYLMAPVPTKAPLGQQPINPDLPLSKWTIEQSFDTAAECEHWRASAIMTNVKTYLDKDSTDAESKQAHLAANLWWKSLCIATDDLRLKGK
jgi:hypothetical protein